MFLTSSSAMSESFFMVTPIPAFSQEVDISELNSENSSKLLNLNQSLPEDFKKVVKNVISKIFSDMLSQVDERYANQELGLQIDFPSGWHGTYIKPANALVLSRPEINITSYLVNTTEKAFYSFLNSIPLSENITAQDIFQAAINPVMNEAFESFKQVTPAISVSAISKDSIKSLQNLSGIEPPTKSLASIWYDYTPSVMNQMLGNLTDANNPLGRNEIKSVNSTEINGVPIEVATSELVVPQSGKSFKTLGYLFLTPDNIINVEYTGDTNNYKKYLPEFENSINSVKITNPIPINEENIKQFVK
jgi:hypothetical protein